MQVEVRFYRGDITSMCKLPMPFRDNDGAQVGDVIAVRFDGEYTVATVVMLDAVVEETTMPSVSELQREDEPAPLTDAELSLIGRLKYGEISARIAAQLAVEVLHLRERVRHLEEDR